MKATATILELTAANCDTCSIKVQMTAPFSVTLDLVIDSHLGGGIPPERWRRIFRQGREVKFDLDPANDMRVDGFTVGNYMRWR